MDQYELYCLADPIFYDTLDHRRDEYPDFSLTTRPAPAGWVIHATDTWMYCGPIDTAPLPAQGWKIHVSACLADAEHALAIAWDYCVPRGIAFKFLRAEPVLVMFNSKSASRSSSGKLVTVYPRDEGQLELVLKELDELMRDIKGPYILSDLRYGEGPLFVRYGGFAERRCLSESGERVLAIEDGEGNLIPDVRGSTFVVPPWTNLPEFLSPHLAARNAVTTTAMPYKIESVLHFSNGGGVYFGRDSRTQLQVVLKEARPHAGLDAVGRDAVTRLGHERDILERLAGLDVVPAVLDYFTLGDHHFLVQEFVDGNPLQRLLVRRYPLTRTDCSKETIAEYTRWVLETIPRIERAVEALHERGVVFGDLHPNNILITEQGRLVLIDFEVATLVEEDSRAALAHPAFGAPADRRGVAADRYALACLALGLFAPQTTTMLPVHLAKVVELGDLIAETFPVPSELVEDAVRTILGSDQPPAERRWSFDSWPELRDAMHRAIRASATPERDDRLFPGDVAQFEPGGGLNIAHGAAGVLYALAETAAEQVPEETDWLRKRAVNPTSGMGLGFYDGLHGIAYVLDRLGYPQDALDVMDIAMRERWEELEVCLFSGLAGIGLNLLHLADVTGDRGFADHALRAVDICADRLGGPNDVPEISGGTNPRAGLMYGSSGPALLFSRAYERTGDSTLLDHAAVALRQDLRRCVRAEDGSLQVNQGWRYLPYLDEGSVGIALALARYLEHREDETFSRALDDLRVVARSRYFVQSGLFTGRSSMITSLAMTRSAGQPPDPVLIEQIRSLRLHAMPYGEGLAFPGDQLLRLSMDLATGTAGVLFALGAALNERPIFLPFTQPTGGAGDRGPCVRLRRPADPDKSRKEV